MVVSPGPRRQQPRSRWDRDPQPADTHFCPSAAIIQGAARGITLQTLETPVDSEANLPRPGPTPRTTGGLFVDVRRETTGLLAATLGEERLRQLRAEGEAMDDDRAVAYTLDQIAKALTDSAHASTSV